MTKQEWLQRLDRWELENKLLRIIIIDKQSYDERSNQIERLNKECDALKKAYKSEWEDNAK